jgi:hypothetical protein
MNDKTENQNEMINDESPILRNNLAVLINQPPEQEVSNDTKILIDLIIDMKNDIKVSTNEIKIRVI